MVLTALVAVVAAAMAFAYCVVLDADYFQIEKTAVTGCEKIVDKEVIALSGIRPHQNLLSLNLDKIRQKIRANPWVDDVSVRREWPDKLVIEVKERKAVALLRKENTLYFVDANAKVFKKLENNESAELPILTGFGENGENHPEMIRKSLDLLSFLAKYNGFPRVENISEIHGDEDFGFSLFADNGISIRLGFGGYEDKLNRLKPIMADLAREIWKASFSLI